MELANVSRYVGDWTTPLSFFGFTLGGIALVIILAWSLYWKGLALWKASKHDNKKWFIVLLLVNTLGILEILYIYVFSKRHRSS